MRITNSETKAVNTGIAMIKRNLTALDADDAEAAAQILNLRTHQEDGGQTIAS